MYFNEVYKTKSKPKKVKPLLDVSEWKPIKSKIIPNKPFINNSEHNIMNFVKEIYPNAVYTVICMDKWHYSIYKDSTYKEKIAETLYTDIKENETFLGVKLIFKWL